MKTTKYISYFLGFTILLFGILKHFSPFKDWIHAQIIGSRLPRSSMSLAIIGEITTGALYLLPFLFKSRLESSKKLLLNSANIILIIMMLVACYVHMQPNVSADVLPMKIKQPYIPIMYIILALINMYSLRKNSKKNI